MALVSLLEASGRRSRLMWAGLAAAAALRAETPVEGIRGDAVPDEEVRIKGVFNSELPRTERKHYLRMIVHPHFGDLHREDYLRAPIGLRYGLTENWEVSAAIEGYFAHGLGDESFFNKYGLSAMQLGTKYRPNWTFVPGWEMGMGLDYSHPLDHPPVDITDGLSHTKPYLTFARDFPEWQGLRVFWGVGVDEVSETSVQGRLEKNDFGSSSNSFTAGFVWPRTGFTYTFESTYATTALLGEDNEHRITVRPGMIFELPQQWTFHSRGQWLMGVATPVTWGPDGWEVGLSVKLRGNFNLKKMIRGGGN